MTPSPVRDNFKVTMEMPDTPVNASPKGVKPCILVVDDEPGIRTLLRTVLEQADYEVVAAACSADALAAAADSSIAVAIVDILLPDMNGLQLSRRLRKDHGIEVILLTGDERALSYADAVRSGACDFILKPINVRELVLRSERAIEARQIRAARDRSVQELQLLSITDPLTGLFNSRHFFQLLKAELVRAKRYARDVALLLLDLDGFKRFNDTYGHQEGDRALRRVGKTIQDSLRETDSAYRYGGEEFTVILPETGHEAALLVAQRLLERIAAAEFNTLDGNKAKVTASIGMAHWHIGENMMSLLKRADLAMYESKRRGRNRVTASVCRCTPAAKATENRPRARIPRNKGVPVHEK